MKRREVEPLCLTVPEAANAIRVSENEFREWVRAGEVRSVRWTPTSHPLIPVVELHRLIAERSGGAA